MLQKLKSKGTSQSKRLHINSFLFFLIFAVIIWFFVQFSKVYNEIVEIPVEYVNMPPDKLLTSENPSVMSLRMEENGFKIAWYSLFPPTLRIDLSGAEQEENELLYVIDEHRNEILSQLKIDFDNSRFVKDVIRIKFEQKQKKTLPVVPRIDLSFAAGYSAAEELRLEPDSVLVTGPDGLLDTLSVLYTKSLNLEDVKEDVSGQVLIDTAGYSHLKVYNPVVKYTVGVEKFTEGSVQVPIELINVPDDLNVVIFPKETLLFYQVALKDYNQVTTSDFRIVADFAQVKENQDFLIPQIIKKPVFTGNLRLNEKKIQFIIKK